MVLPAWVQTGKEQGTIEEVSPKKPPRRCAIYARISVTQDESVSLARQVEAAEQYAAARGWQVVAAGPPSLPP